MIAMLRRYLRHMGQEEPPLKLKMLLLILHGGSIIQIRLVLLVVKMEVILFLNPLTMI